MFPDQRRTHPASWGAVCALALLVAWVLACLLNANRSKVADDAFITFNYARNLAEGFGLRFNASDAEPTAGASSMLHALYSTAAIRVGADPLVATRALSIAAFVMLGASFGWTASLLARTSSAAGIVAGLVVCALWGLVDESWVHLASGMDTMLFTLVHGWAACWAALAAAKPGRALALAGLVPLGLLIVARPEGWILATGYVAVVALARRGGQGALAALIGEAPLLALTATLVVAWFTWRYSYYGQALGNAYYVKVDNELFGSDGEWLPGGDTTLRFLLVRWAPCAALALALASAARAPQDAVLRGALLLAPSLLVVVVYSLAIHEMAAGFRFEYPMLAPLALAIVATLCLVHRRSPVAFASALGLAGFALPLLASPTNPPLLNWIRHPRSLALSWIGEAPHDNALARVGLDLGETQLGQRASILLSGAGQAPYYSRFRAIDWIGLNNKRFNGSEPLTVDQMWREIDVLAPDVCFSILPPASPGAVDRERDPNWRSASVQRSLQGRGSALFLHWNPQRLADSFWREMTWIRDHCEFGAAYRLGPAWGDEWWVLLYVRRDSPHRERLLEVLRSSRRADRDADLGAAFAFDPRELGRSP